MINSSARRVILAFAITSTAAAIELFGSWRGHSYFLTADAVHLLAHSGIFAALLVPRKAFGRNGEIVATAIVLTIVLVIAAGIIVTSLGALRAGNEKPDPLTMVLSLFGLGANLASALLFQRPAGKRVSFRLALAHELSDGALTVIALVGAVAIARWGWRWLDPALSLSVGVWLAVWAVKTLVARQRHPWDASSTHNSGLFSNECFAKSAERGR